MDIKIVLPNGELDVEIYVDQPDGFVAKDQEGMVYRLIKPLYVWSKAST